MGQNWHKLSILYLYIGYAWLVDLDGSADEGANGINAIADAIAGTTTVIVGGSGFDGMINEVSTAVDFYSELP